MIKNTRTYIFILFHFVFCFAHGQNLNTVSGIVTDQITGKPIPYVSVSANNNVIGSISNLNGEFVLKYPKSENTDTVHLSHLSYASKDLYIKQIEDSLVVKLKPFEYVIKEVDVWPQNPDWLVSKSIEKISDNYFNKPLNFTAFYREIIRENDNKIQHLEAILDIYKASVTNKKDKDRIKINKGIIFQDVHNSLIWNYIKFVNSPYELLQADFAKHPNNFVTVAQSRINFLNNKHFKYYNYNIVEKNYSLSKDQIIIQFKPKSKPKRAVFEGFIYMDIKTLSILRIEYYFSYDRINSARIIDNQTHYYLLELGAYIKAVEFYTIINYKKYDDQWIISHSNMGYDFVFVEKEKRFPTKISAKFDLVITDIDSTNVSSFKSRNWIKYQESMVKQISKFDKEFWEDYNFIPFEN